VVGKTGPASLGQALPLRYDRADRPTKGSDRGLYACNLMLQHRYHLPRYAILLRQGRSIAGVILSAILSIPVCQYHPSVNIDRLIRTALQMRLGRGIQIPTRCHVVLRRYGPAAMRQGNIGASIYNSNRSLLCLPLHTFRVPMSVCLPEGARNAA